MKNATLPLYIRFGEIPQDKISKVHFGDAVVRGEGGLSVWEAVEADMEYYPILPECANESAVADYFRLLFSNKSVYLVTGQKMRLEGADREPLLIPETVVVIKKLNYSYLKQSESEE